MDKSTTVLRIVHGVLWAGIGLSALYCIAPILFRHRPHTLLYSVHQTRQVRFENRERKWEYSSLAHSDAVAVFRHSGGFHRKPRGHTSGDTVRIIIQDDTVDYPRHYEYIPETGEIGQGDEWCTIPVALNDSLRRSMLSNGH